jgi:inositol-phosphate phosphatase/L-galactose 1-phosphate phosphatase/histidinol-phosphatase
MQRVPDEAIALAHDLADAAGEIVRRHFRKPVAVETKPDASPVSEVDKAVEIRLREIVAHRAPSHGFIGEEFPATSPEAELAWIVDPIDGTRSFLVGLPLFGTLIALRHGGDYVLGLVDQPITRERWIGADGHGASLNGRAIRTRACASLAEAVVTTSGPDDYAAGDYPAMRPLHLAGRWVMYGNDCYDYGLLAMGGHDIIVDSNLAEHDFAAPEALIRNAGGHCCDWQGRPLGAASDGRVLMVGDPRLLEPSLDRLHG